MLKRQMFVKFEIKYMLAAKYILDMSIIWDIFEGTSKLSKGKYIEKLMQKLNVQNVMTRSTSLETNFNLTKK